MEKILQMGGKAESSIQVVELGLGKWVTNWGSYNGVPAVFLEPVAGVPGEVGETLPDGREPQITRDLVSSGGIVFEIHDASGLEVFIEDLRSAVSEGKKGKVVNG